MGSIRRWTSKVNHCAQVEKCQSKSKNKSKSKYKSNRRSFDCAGRKMRDLLRSG
jgi:hypothetical protein